MKLAQHPAVAELLLSTGDAELVEDSPKDYFWGCGAVREVILLVYGKADEYGQDRSGRNELGKILMKSRARLQAAQADVVKGALDLTRMLHI